MDAEATGRWTWLGPRTWLEGAAAAVAGLAAVGVFGVLVAQPSAAFLTFAAPGWRPVTGALALLVAAAAVATVLPGPVRGWPTTVIGLAMLSAVALGLPPVAGPYLGVEPSYRVTANLAAAFAAGLVIGGVISVRPPSPAGRVAVLAGLAGGVVVLPGAVALLARDGLPAGSVHLAGTVLAGLAAVVARGPARPGRPERLGPAVVVVVTAILTYVGDLVRSRVVYALLNPDGPVSSRRVNAVETANRYGYLALALGVALILLWYALSAGGPLAGRWTAVGVGVGLPLGVATISLYGAIQPVISVVAAAVGVIAGPLLVRYAGRRQAWAGVGLLACAGGVAALVLIGVVGSALLGLGLGLALAAGLAVSAAEPASGTGPARHTPTGRALLGLGAALLVGHLVMPTYTPMLIGRPFPDLPLAGLAFVIGAAFVELILFGLDRWTRARARPGTDALHAGPSVLG